MFYTEGEIKLCIFFNNKFMIIDQYPSAIWYKRDKTMLAMHNNTIC
jgi:hypothetical protein